jgi:uncharacterized membrane protein
MSTLVAVVFDDESTASDMRAALFQTSLDKDDEQKLREALETPAATAA